ncbi:MAG: sodium/proline symporter PutP [archaeon]|nr:sodium/proline symporter PutP [archaeon]
MDAIVLVGFIAYFIVVLLVGFYFYNKSHGIKDYVLGGRKLNPYVAALSAQASDMSGWLLLGLPGSIYLAGVGQAWIGIGLAIGSYLAWLFVAKRLRHYSKKANDSITLSQYFSNRFGDSKNYLKTLSAIVIIVFFVPYVASGFVSAGNVLLMIFPEFDYTMAMLVGVVVIIAYTVLGGFKAICWTDVLQALLMLVAIIIVPLAAMGNLGGWDHVVSTIESSPGFSGFFDFFKNADGTTIGALSIISSLAWGLGYSGMPHILVRYMALEDPKEARAARRVGTGWIIVALAFAILVGIVGQAYHPGFTTKAEAQTIFIVMVAGLFAPIIMGVLYSALMAAVMSTADSQLLVASAAVTNDLVSLTNKEYSEEKLMWMSRIVVIVVAIIAAVLAWDPNSSIMDLVSYAWAGFGAAFGPVVLLSLFWKRSNGYGALAGMLTGFIVVIFWNTFMVAGGVFDYHFIDTGLYELVPGFFLALIVMIIVSLATAEPSKEIQEQFDEVSNETDGFF